MRIRPREDEATCPFCHDVVESSGATNACAVCAAEHHVECWTSHGKCSACGSDEVAQASTAEPPRIVIRTRDEPCSERGCKRRRVEGSQNKKCRDHEIEFLERDLASLRSMWILSAVFGVLLSVIWIPFQDEIQRHPVNLLAVAIPALISFFLMILSRVLQGVRSARLEQLKADRALEGPR